MRGVHSPATLTLALTTPLLPTSGARFLPHSGANRRDLCCPPRSSGVSVAGLDAGAARRRSRELPRSWKGGGRVRRWDGAERGSEPEGRKGGRGGAGGGVNPENVSDEDGDTLLLSGRAEHQSGSERTGASLSLSLTLPSSPSTTYHSVSVASRHFSHFHAPRGEAEEQSPMAGREPAYYAAKRYHGVQSSAIKPPGSMDLPEHSLFYSQRCPLPYFWSR